ncbi:hypothetical protein TraAM80_10525, partial [Trypanosoma rangeli]
SCGCGRVGARKCAKKRRQKKTSGVGEGAAVPQKIERVEEAAPQKKRHRAPQRSALLYNCRLLLLLAGVAGSLRGKARRVAGAAATPPPRVPQTGAVRGEK